METMIPPLRQQGIQALHEGNLDEAIDRLLGVVAEDDQDSDALAFLGVAYSQRGMHAEAKRALQTAVHLRPQEARYHFNLGVALEQAGEWSIATAAYRRVLQIAPSHAQARSKLQEL